MRKKKKNKQTNKISPPPLLEMGYYILLLLYAALLLFYAAHYKEPPIRPWSRMSPFIPDDKIDPSKTCRDHDECPPHYKCVSGLCYPEFLRGEECSEDTGKWIVMTQYERKFAVCTCTYPDVFTNKYFGGNCNVSVACQPDGRYSWDEKKCHCNPGFKEVGLKCLKMSALEKDTIYACSSDEIERQNASFSYGFHSDYLSKNQDKKCFKKPCKFDAYSGLPLKNSHYEEGIGCVCDPTLGQFGVRIQNTKTTPFPYLLGEGYNACASIYKIPLETPQPVNMYSYFYLMDRSPVVFLQYNNVDISKLIPPFQKVTFQKSFGFIFSRLLSHTNTLQITQEFPYDYMQTFFKKRMWENAKRLQTYQLSKSMNHVQQRFVLEKQTHHVEWCRYMMRKRHLSKIIKFGMRYRIYDYNLLYNFPACYVGINDTESPEMYRGRYVLNPFQLTMKEDPDDNRFNGLHVGFDGHQWNVDFAPPYKIETYMAAAATSTNIPKVTNAIVDKIEQSDYFSITTRILDDFENTYQSENSARSINQEPNFFP